MFTQNLGLATSLVSISQGTDAGTVTQIHNILRNSTAAAEAAVQLRILDRVAADGYG